MTKTNKRVLLISAIIFISFNLRAPITSVGSLADLIRNDLEVSNGFIGFITTLPLLAFAFFSPFVSNLAGRYGIKKTMSFGMFAIIAGGIIRSYTGSLGLILGTGLIGIGISVGNVLVPSIIKKKFPNKIGIVTSVYITCQGIFAGVGAGLSYPLADNFGLGWKISLSIWSVVALIALFLWLPQVDSDLGKDSFKLSSDHTENKKTNTIKEARKHLLKSPLAWYITIFMGSQSLCYYSVTAWLPSILISKEMTSQAAGYMAFWFQLVGLAISFIVPILSTKMQERQTFIAAAMCIFYFIGIVTLPFGNHVLIVMAELVFTSIGASATYSWIIVILTLKSKNAWEVSLLSGMSQSVGYLFAAMGPTLSGILYDIYGNWNMTIGFLLAIVIIMLFSGILITRTDKL
ncbi:CynX/NimT family MFS transporter [Anaerovorax odorimutans]|uniref:CynX/NimT family MFS transporter n=1 Tax=Anaerovorax odorimutans TaxID=109327 RepID=UPI00040755B3|nr:MFS transporter [Anaerovorax odorimutans]